MGTLSSRLRRHRLAAIGSAAVLFAAAYAVHRLDAAATPALVAAAVGLAAAGGGPAGLVLAIAGAGVSSVETPVRIAFAVCALAVFERSSRLSDEATRIEQEAFTDRLTGLYTYAYFSEVLALEVQRVRRYGGCCALIVLDLDRFKEFNDRYGHALGNALLADAGAAVRRLKRDSDVAARFGGEEFVILVPGSGREALALAERIRETVGLIGVATGVSGQLIGGTISAGVAECPADARTAAELFDAADAALYRAKDAGRNRVLMASGDARAGNADVSRAQRAG